MTTRRTLLGQITTVAASAALSNSLFSSIAAQAQPPAGAPPRAPGQADEMTTNITQQRRRMPGYDFGPLPTKLPPEAEAVKGKNSLQAHASKFKILAGAAVPVRALQADPVFQELVADQYGILVPENELKMVALRPSLDKFDFTASDALLAFTKQHGMKLRGHTLVWHGSVPQWVRQQSSTLDLRKVMVEHIQTVMGHYKGQIQAWDVVNEAILPSDGDPNGMRKTVWFNAMGPEYIDLAFRTAREADPNAKLSYNDYGVEYDKEDQAEKRRLILAMVRKMKAANVPIDAIGVQAHIRVGFNQSMGTGLKEYIEAIRQMGLDVYVTELDVNEDDVTYDDVEKRDAAVADTYRQFLTLMLSNPATKAVLTWGVTDRRTWLNGFNGHSQKFPNRPQRCLPFDAAYKPKPAFFAIRDSFDHKKI